MKDKNIMGILIIALILSAHAAIIPFYYEEENTGKDCKKPELP